MDIMGMTLTKGCRCDLHEASVLVKLFDRPAAAVAHSGADTARHLKDHVLKSALVCDSSFDALGNQLLCALLKVTVL